MRPSSPPFAERVRERMRERGLGLREFCRTVAIDPSFFSKVLAGKRSPPSDEDVLRRIAAALAVDAPSLIVSAGRIPLEWERLWRDGALLDAVHRMASGSAGAGAWSARQAAPSKAPAARRPFGEELL